MKSCQSQFPSRTSRFSGRLVWCAALIAAAVMLPVRTTHAWSEVNIPGDWDSWNQADTSHPWLLNKVTAPGTPSGVDWYTNMVHVASSGGDTTTGTHQFKIVGDQNWANQWGNNPVVLDNTTLMSWNGNNATGTFSTAGYYNFRILNPPSSATATVAVMRTASPPVTLQVTSQTPQSPQTNNVVTIGLTLGASPSAQENFYVRWTTNNWGSSIICVATGSGTSWSATIPAMPNGIEVQYYAFSSTAATNGNVLTTSTADALTLNLDSNAGSNYSYFSYTMPWPGGAAAGYPSDPASNIHHWKEEAVVGNGFINVMLDQNGCLYDIYYPSVGDRHGVSTSNEGYRGPEQFPNCPSLDNEAMGQMNAIAGMCGIGNDVAGTNTIYWLQNTSGTTYSNVGQQWDSDSVNVILTTNTLTAGGNNISLKQYDFCPSTNALPIVTDGTRTNFGVYVKRYLIMNNASSSNTVDFYYDANFNINGGNTNDAEFWDTVSNNVTYNAMVAYDNTGRTVPVQSSDCDPNGYTTEYSPSFAFGWSKQASLYFGVAMKLVTNSTTGAGSPADGSWRDHTATDNQEGWIGKRLQLAPNSTNEVDVMVVGSWDDSAGQTGTYQYWNHPQIAWFYTNSMATAQATTETYWSNWLSAGVTINFPDNNYNKLFKRSMLLTALHIDAVTGSIIAGMHNGAYPFVWPRDGVYAAITLDRTGHTNESAAFYGWLQNTAYRDSDCVDGGKGFFYQKYTTDGYKVWTSPQLDESASVPWGMYYHYLSTGDGSFLSNYWNLAFTSINASSENSCSNSIVFYDGTNNLMNGNNVWEDTNGEHIYSNASIVRGLRDAANIANFVGSGLWNGGTNWPSTWTTRANNIVTGIVARMNFQVEPADISHLGIAVPYEVLQPNNTNMTNVVEWINGRQKVGTCSSCESAGGPWFDDLIETDSVNYADSVGLANRYIHNENGSTESYWANEEPGHSPWFLATSWYGEYFARWQDYVGGTAMINTNKYMLDLLTNKVDNLMIAAEQIAPKASLQNYTGFWLQTAWPNVWESHSTMVDQMMMFLDYKPEGTNGVNTCYFAPKLPDAWSSITFSNLNSQGQRFDVTISETNGCTCTEAQVNKRNTGTLNYDIWLRIPTNKTPSSVVTNGLSYNPSSLTYNTTTGRVHIQGAFTNGIGNNTVVVNY